MMLLSYIIGNELDDEELQEIEKEVDRPINVIIIYYYLIFI